MTPLKLGLALIVILFCCKAMEGFSKAEIEKTIGGLALVILFADFIWAIFYYINI